MAVERRAAALDVEAKVEPLARGRVGHLVLHLPGALDRSCRTSRPGASRRRPRARAAPRDRARSFATSRGRRRDARTRPALPRSGACRCSTRGRQCQTRFRRPRKRSSEKVDLTMSVAVRASVPGELGALVPVRVRILADRVQAHRARRDRASSIERHEVALELLDGGGSAQHDVRPTAAPAPSRARARPAVRPGRFAPTAASSGTSPRSVSRPFASASLTITPRPSAWAAASAGPADRSSRFHVACTASKPPTSSARSIVSRLMWARSP